MNFKDLKLKEKNNFNTMIVNNIEVKVYQTSTFKDKQDLIGMVLTEGFKDGGFDLLKARKAFDMGIISLYTDIVIAPEDKDEAYDLFNQYGVIDTVYDNIDDSEIAKLRYYFKESVGYQLQYGYSFIGFAKEVLTEIPDRINEATKELENFNPEQYKELMNFVKSANADRLPVDMEDESFMDMAINKVKGKLN